MFTFKKLIIVFVLVTPLLTACGISRDVKVTLTDFGIESSLTTFRAGVPYHFVVTNAGTVHHEIMLIEPRQGGEEDMDRFALTVIEEDILTPGTTKSFDYKFTEPAPEGSLEFACHVEGHYEAGMHLPIRVK